MTPAGSRFLFGAAVLATIGAVVYGITQEGSLGTIGLISAALALFLLAGVNLYTRDADVSSMDPAATTESAAAAPAPGPSLWPLIAAVGAVLFVVGLITYPVILIFGLVALLAATVEWMVQAWSERASADSRFNEGVRARIAHPLEFPILGAVALGIVIYSFSRIMLFLSKSGGPAVFIVIAALILVSGFLFAYRPSLRGGAIAGVMAIAAVGLVTGGIVAALEGERETEAHETTGDLAAEGACDTPDETEADDNASQNVAAKANLTAEIILESDGTLVARSEGVDEPLSTLAVVRNNPTNVLFRNESAEDRRLVLDLGTRPEVDEATGETVPDTEVANQICTTLVEDGGSQFMTFSIAEPSELAENPYRFVVPGVDGAEVGVVVP
jgi:predicted phage tail protein